MSSSKPEGLPGYGLPIEHMWDNEYVQYNTCDSFERATAREIAMVRMMNEITDKPEWHDKILNETIVAKWRKEAVAAEISEQMVDWCIEELREKAECYRVDQIVTALDVFVPIVKADEVVSTELQEELRDSLLAYRDSLDVLDWHPGSNEQVLNLVHPSLYPLVYGRTHALDLDDHLSIDTCLSRSGAGHVLPVQPAPVQPAARPLWQRRNDTSWKFSHQFQWLPCEVQVNKRDDSVQISSYVNNLHPVKARKIYSLLERLIATSIPLWSKCMPVHDGSTSKRIFCDSAEYNKPEFQVEGAGLSDEETRQKIKKLAQPEGLLHWCKDEEQIVDECPEDEDLSTWLEQNADNWAVSDHIIKSRRKLQLPEPDDYTSARKPWLIYDSDCKDGEEVAVKVTPRFSTDRYEKWSDKGLQVIVKIASIELTPGKPQYAGGSWHLEGMQNEHIAATALYYYDCKNVTESRLHFRAKAELDSVDMHYEQDDHDGLEKIYGLPPGGLRNSEQVQELGSVVTKEGRLLAFSNVLQHKVGPFELEDKTQPGWRRFVALWLVDPVNRIISTKNVPPQQHDWWKMALIEKTNLLRRLPIELTEQVFRDGQEFTMTAEEAEAHRLKLMAERTTYVQGVDEAWRSQTYNFCEH